MALNHRFTSRFVGATAAAVVAVVAPAAHATVEGMLQSTVAYAHPELEGYCYAEVPISAEIGIPAASVAEGAVAPTYALRSGSGGGAYEAIDIGGRSYVNINAAADLGGLAHQYVNDGFDAQAVVYEATLDASALAAARGSDPAGREQTIVQSKLALLTMARSLRELSSSGLFSLRVEFVGLPDQSDLPGATLNATTQYPYTGGSPLLASYEAELLAVECPIGPAFAAKADGPGAAAPSPEPVDGAPKPKKCSVSGVGSPVGWAGLAPGLLFAVVVAARRRRAGG